MDAKENNATTKRERLSGSVALRREDGELGAYVWFEAIAQSLEENKRTNSLDELLAFRRRLDAIIQARLAALGAIPAPTGGAGQ